MNFFHVTDSVEEAVAEIEGFYRNYHSSRFVGGRLVLRLHVAPTDERLEGLIRDQVDAIETLEAAGAKTKPIEQRFSDAGMSAEYDGWYRFFSEFVHRGLKIIENRYFEQDGKGNWIFPPDLNKPWMKVDIDKFQATMDYLLKDARKELLDNGILTD